MDVLAEDVRDGEGDVKIRWLITQKDGAPNFAMRVFELSPNSATPYHVHPWEHEVYVLEGKCKIVSEKGDVFCEEGDVAFVPPGIKHQFRNVGDGKLKFICVIPIIKSTPEC
ncbi:MAG: cupin [Thermoplasmata archaeon]|nr:MAG: cupin [Thermoplasmata archaeon]